MPAEPGATRQRTGGGGPRPEAPRLLLSRRETLGGASALALMALLVGCGAPAEVAGRAGPRGEAWDDGTYWDDGTGWV